MSECVTIRISRAKVIFYLYNYRQNLKPFLYAFNSYGKKQNYQFIGCNRINPHDTEKIDGTITLIDIPFGWTGAK